MIKQPAFINPKTHPRCLTDRVVVTKQLHLRRVRVVVVNRGDVQAKLALEADDEDVGGAKLAVAVEGFTGSELSIGDGTAGFAVASGRCAVGEVGVVSGVEGMAGV